MTMMTQAGMALGHCVIAHCNLLAFNLRQIIYRVAHDVNAVFLLHVARRRSVPEHGDGLTDVRAIRGKRLLDTAHGGDRHAISDVLSLNTDTWSVRHLISPTTILRVLPDGNQGPESRLRYRPVFARYPALQWFPSSGIPRAVGFRQPLADAGLRCRAS